MTIRLSLPRPALHGEPAVCCPSAVTIPHSGPLDTTRP